jgi:MoxR-like ATPase
MPNTPIAGIEKMDAKQALELLNAARAEMAKRVVAQSEMIDGLLTALIAGGHILIEGVPGLAKTRAVKALAEITGLDFKRVQFTPDLLPADLTGTLIWEPAKGSFSAASIQTARERSPRRTKGERINAAYATRSSGYTRSLR